MNEDEDNAVVVYMITNSLMTTNDLIPFVGVTLDNFYRLKLDTSEGMITALFIAVLVILDADYDLGSLTEYCDKVYDTTEVNKTYPYKSSISDKRQIRSMMKKCNRLARKFKSAFEMSFLVPDDIIYVAGTVAAYMAKNTDLIKEDFMNLVDIIANRGKER